ncbi:MBL fold metallo-hydrolase, partial [Candidatus Saccharibacteria bacterium]|nr:MBL fold metallo-hydrolase [Candidatus Saccharibacteria bacterium]
TDLGGISAVVVTHVHGDHFDSEKLQKIISQNPDAKIFTTQEVVDKFPQNTKTVKNGETVDVNGTVLEFFGEQHAEIDPKTPLNQNIGVLVNQKLYYPGDSFTECNKQFDILAVPASAPWLRVGQTIPLIENSKCNQVFPIHNALLSDIGDSITNTWLQKFSERSGKSFTYLKPGESTEI